MIFPALTLFVIAAGQARDQLPVFTTQAGLQVLYGYDDVEGIETHAVYGEMPPQEALTRMLQGTRASFDFMDSETITLTVKPYDNLPDSAPVRIQGHDYTCAPLRWIIGMTYGRLGRLLFDMGQIAQETQFCTNERPVDSTRRADAAETVVSVNGSNEDRRRPRSGPIGGPHSF
jgi:hypothetical protein